MKVEVSSDKPITDAVLGQVVAAVDAGLSRYKSRLTRAEIHLKNIDREVSTRSVECTLEVRPVGRDPVVTGHEAEAMEGAVGGATDKMGRLLDSLFGRLDSIRGGASASGLPT